MEKKRLLPIGIQDFEDLRKKGFIYVDKTALVYKLATEGKPYFLSRPRRFGKSLLISTMKAYFLGKKELFEGLAIEQMEQDWIEYPVININFANDELIATSNAVPGYTGPINLNAKVIVEGNVTGQILPYREIAEICRENNICFILFLSNFD